MSEAPLRKVVRRIPFSRAYLTRTFWYEELECGHVDAYSTEWKRVQRRHCLACAISDSHPLATVKVKEEQWT